MLGLLAACWSGGSDPGPGSAGAPSAAVIVSEAPPDGLTATSSSSGASTVPEPPPTSTTSTTSSAAPTETPAATSSAPAAPPAPDLAPGLPTTIAPVARGELVSFQVLRQGTVLLNAASSGLARYNASASCEVPGQPCYDAPTLDRVARIDLGAPPTVPGTDTTFITGHSNRYAPNDPARGVFSTLQNVRTGDTLVLRTTKGTFVYAVSTTLSVPFDKLTSTDAVARVRADTVVAISCIVAPDRGSYLGNYVVVGTLRASSPA